MTPGATSSTESETSVLLRELRSVGPALGLKQLLESRIASGPDEREALESRLFAVIEESGRLTMVSAAEALDATAFVVELADASGLDLARARARRARARALAYAGRFGEALASCSEAITLAMRCGRPEEAARARLASMHALAETGRLDEAIEAGQAARHAFEAIGEPALAARADNNLGIVFQRRDEPAAALECFERAQPLLADDPVALGHLENSRGEALLVLNEFSAAEGAFAAALEAFEHAGADLTAAIAEGNLGDLAMRHGRFREALRYFERARRRFERSDSPGHLARLIAEQAEAKALMGLTDEAIDEYEQALARLEECGMPLEQARARMAVGVALCRAGRFAQAETALSAAATAFEELKHFTARARVDLVRAELAARTGNGERLRDARATALRALAALESRPVDAAAARHLLGRLAMRMNDTKIAECELGAALGIADGLGIAPMQCEIHHSLGMLWRAAGRIDDAISHLVLAVQFSERLRATIQAERFRTAFLGDRTSLYEELVDCLLHRGDEPSIAHALEVAERCKSRTLLDRIEARAAADTLVEAGPPDDAERELIERMTALRGELNALYSRLGDDRFTTAAAGAAAGRTHLPSWRARIGKLEQQLGDVESRLASAPAHGIADLYAPSATYEQIRAALRPHQALIEYFFIGEELIAFVVRADRPAIAQRLGGAALPVIADRMERLQFQIDRALRRFAGGAQQVAEMGRLLADAQRELGVLYERLIAPIEAAIDGVSRLIVVPHGPLHALPFHALWNPASGEYLDDRLTVGTTPSASSLARPRNRGAAHQSTQRGRPLVIAVADEIVPNVLGEAADLAGRLDAEVLAEHEATVAQVRHAASQHDVLHFACHGRFDPATPHASGLLLADGWLTLRDIYSLRLEARLVFLCACETALGRVESGDEVLGLQRAFLAAGAETLLLALWRVPDQAAADFARIFYSTWHNEGDATVDATEAARQVRAVLRMHHSHPAVWAPFVVTGGEL